MQQNRFIINIMGGLGNQMFQYAYIKALSKRTGIDFLLDFSFFKSYSFRAPILNCLSIDNKMAPAGVLQRAKQGIPPSYKFMKKHRLVRHILNIDLFEEQEGSPCIFDEKFYNLADPGYISGYFQTEKYFKEIRKSLMKDFLPKSGFSMGFKNMKKQITNPDFTSVSVHIRRGDFTSPIIAKVHGSCTLSYYEKAFDVLAQSVSNIKLFIFSDDPEWARANLKAPFPMVFMDDTQPNKPYEDIWLMASCDHNILANSSFSWWGTWLNENPEKMVIAPKRWFAKEEIKYDDIYCEKWITIRN